jgi:BlaI family transcriptional regulator, penicillinase repressor
MKSRPRISEAEREVMAVLWARSPQSTPEIVEALSEAKGWAPRTIRTLLGRLVKKKALALESEGRRHLFRPKLNRDECREQESRSFLDRVFGGEPASMLVSLVRQADLTPEQIRELKAILEEKEK